MTKELQQLYDYLKLNYTPLTTDDLSINEPDQWEETDYICCDQKIIIWLDGYYNVSDLYDSHPSLRFRTKEEIVSFYEGYNEGFVVNFTNKISSAKSIGRLTAFTEVIDMEKSNENWKVAVSPHQFKYNDTDADAG